MSTKTQRETTTPPKTSNRKPKETTKPKAKRVQRTPQERLDDLKAKTAIAEARVAASAVSDDPVGKAFLTAVRATNKALNLAEDSADSDKDDGMSKALRAASDELFVALKQMGLAALFEDDGEHDDSDDEPAE